MSWPYGPMQIQVTSSAGPAWDYSESFTLVDGQADYVFGTGASASGSIGSGASTDAKLALVQWGVTVLVPVADYTVLSDRIRLVSAPDAAQASSGQPLVVRVKRAS